MRKLYLLSDEWNNDRNFVGSELELIKEYFEVTVVCNDSSMKDASLYPKDVKILFYKRKNGIRVLFLLLKCLLDASFWKEMKNLKGEINKTEKISEIVRFYINAELFFDYFRRNCLLDKNTDAVIYSYWYFWKCFAITKHRNKYPNVRIITRVHGYDLYKEQLGSGYQPFKKIMDENLDRVVFIAEHGLEYYLNEFGITKCDRHIICKLGTRKTVFPDEFMGGRTEDYGGRGDINIVSCSSVIELKRVDIIVKALSLIDDLKVKWIHFGGGPLLGDLKKLAEELLDKKDNVEYSLVGQVLNDEIHDYYRNNRVDVFMMMSRSEGNPISVIEAMSYGIPIVSTNINNMKNLVKNNGFLVSANPTNTEVAEAIRKICCLDSEKTRITRDASRKIWEQEFDGKKNNERFVKEVLFRL